MGPLGTALCGVVTQLQGIALPAAIIGLIIAVVGMFLVPVMGDAVAAARGTIRTIIVGVAFLGLLPAIVNGMAAVGGFTGSGCAFAGPLNTALHMAPPTLGMAVLVPVGVWLRRRFVRVRKDAAVEQTYDATASPVVCDE